MKPVRKSQNYFGAGASKSQGVMLNVVSQWTQDLTKTLWQDRLLPSHLSRAPHIQSAACPGGIKELLRGSRVLLSHPLTFHRDASLSKYSPHPWQWWRCSWWRRWLGFPDPAVLTCINTHAVSPCVLHLGLMVSEGLAFLANSGTYTFCVAYNASCEAKSSHTCIYILYRCASWRCREKGSKSPLQRHTV